MLSGIIWMVAILASLMVTAWGADLFAENLAAASVRLGVSAFALALLLAGAEPEELITSIFSSIRHAPAIAVGDVIGTNITICLVALGLAAMLSPFRLPKKTLIYGFLALFLSIPGISFAWSGRIDRGQGIILVALYAIYIAFVWIAEHRPPDIGEVAEIEEAREQFGRQTQGTSRDLVRMLAGLAAMTAGGGLLVYAVQHFSPHAAIQAKLGMTLIGFVTGFELIVLAWSASRRGETNALAGAVVGSFVYNLTMTLGAAAVVRPLQIPYSGAIRFGLIATPCALTLPLLLGLKRNIIGRASAVTLLLAYTLIVILIAR